MQVVHETTPLLLPGPRKHLSMEPVPSAKRLKATGLMLCQASQSNKQTRKQEIQRFVYHIFNVRIWSKVCQEFPATGSCEVNQGIAPLSNQNLFFIGLGFFLQSGLLFSKNSFFISYLFMSNNPSIKVPVSPQLLTHLKLQQHFQ